MSFTDILRTPDGVMLETTGGFEPMRACGSGFDAPGVRLDCAGGRMTVLWSPSAPERAPKRFRLRWKGDNRAVRLVYRPVWSFNCAEAGWHPVIPEEPMPWYFLAHDGKTTVGCGVKTGPNAFAFWQVDAYGVTLWLDVRCGGEGVQPKAPLLAAETVSAAFEGPSYAAAQQFAAMLCPAPRLPSRPVFGSNNWYYAYGNISRESVLEDAALMGSLVDGALRPYMVIDDGWQKNRRTGYIGGPWTPNTRFGDMQETARGIRERGCIPGIWIRTLLSEDPALPDAWKLHRPKGPQPETGFLLDPSVPDVLAQIGDEKYITVKRSALRPHQARFLRVRPRRPGGQQDRRADLPRGLALFRPFPHDRPDHEGAVPDHRGRRLRRAGHRLQHLQPSDGGHPRGLAFRRGYLGILLGSHAQKRRRYARAAPAPERPLLYDGRRLRRFHAEGLDRDESALRRPRLPLRHLLLLLDHPRTALPRRACPAAEDLRARISSR